MPFWKSPWKPPAPSPVTAPTNSQLYIFTKPMKFYKKLPIPGTCPPGKLTINFSENDVMTITINIKNSCYAFNFADEYSIPNLLSKISNPSQPNLYYTYFKDKFKHIFDVVEYKYFNPSKVNDERFDKMIDDAFRLYFNYTCPNIYRGFTTLCSKVPKNAQVKRLGFYMSDHPYTHTSDQRNALNDFNTLERLKVDVLTPFYEAIKTDIETVDDEEKSFRSIINDVKKLWIARLKPSVVAYEALVLLKYILQNSNKPNQTIDDLLSSILVNNNTSIPNFPESFDKPNALNDYKELLGIKSFSGGKPKEYVILKTNGRKYTVVLKNKKKYIRQKGQLVALSDIKGQYKKIV